MRSSNAEEVGGGFGGSADPWDVFSQLVILVVEGRTPGGEKGFHAGPHCTLQSHGGLNRHVCDQNSNLCVRAESLFRQLRLMWGVGVGVSVEVLVAPDCEHGVAFASSLDATAAAPSPQLKLIEQWNVTIYDKNVPESRQTGWSLVTAVRSYLHFSQLAAWLSSSGGASPSNLIYRLTVTSPVFCSKFEGDAEEHAFPVANVGPDIAIKVVVRSLPRSSLVPDVACQEKHVEETYARLEASLPLPVPRSLQSPTAPSLLDSSQSFSSDSGQESSFSSIANSSSRSGQGMGSDPVESGAQVETYSKAEDDLRRSMMRARLGETCRSNRSESPDTQLGESLLDPPNSLSRIPPKRFQSPSRSGSPSMETPEHVICRVRPAVHGSRYADFGGFCQPLTVTNYSWTQARYPSMDHHGPQQSQAALPNIPTHFAHPSYPDIYHTSAIPSGHSPNDVIHTPRIPYVFPHDINPPSFFNSSSSHVLWPQSNLTMNPNHPVYNSQFHVISHESGENSHILESLGSLESPILNLSSNVEMSGYDVSKIEAEDTSSQLNLNEKYLIQVPKLSPATSQTENELVDFADVDSPSAKMKELEIVREGQGTKRKGAYSKESSPSLKRESPPHIYYAKTKELDKPDSDTEVTSQAYPVECDDSCHKIPSSESAKIISDQLWPTCSQSGKHLCSSIEDLAEIESKEDKYDTKKHLAELKSKMELPSCSSKVCFDLTPKETREVLEVLRQNTPVPPLRMDQHVTARKPSFQSCLKDLAFESTQKYLKDLNKPGLSELKDANIETDESTHTAKTADAYKQEEKRCHKYDYTPRQPSTTTEATYRGCKCDNRFKKSSHCNCDKEQESDEFIESDDDVLDGLFIEEAETSETSYFTSKYRNSGSDNRNEESVDRLTYLSNLKNDRRNRTYGKSDVKRALSFELIYEDPESKVVAEKTPIVNQKCSLQSMQKNETGPESGLKSFNFLKHIMKKPYLYEDRTLDALKYQKAKEDTDEELFEEGVEADLINISPDLSTPGSVYDELMDEGDREVEDLCWNKGGSGVAIPSTSEKVKFRRSLDSAASLVFHHKTGLPLTSSPAPLRKGSSFDFDSSLTCIAAIRNAFRSCAVRDEELDEADKEPINRPTPTKVSTSAPASVTCSSLLGNFEECVLNGRLEPVSTVHGFSAEIAASGTFCPKHTTKPVTVFFYTLCDNNQVSSPYMGHINLGKKGYQIPSQGTVQVTLFNPLRTVVKMFVVMYDLADMPPNSKTFLRQRTFNMPVGASETDSDAHQWLRYLIHLRFASSKSGKIYLHTDIRMLILRKSDADAATLHKTSVPYELRSFTHGPMNPKFSPRK